MVLPDPPPPSLEDYYAMNLAHWDSRAGPHAELYGVDRYKSDPAHLSEVVRFDRERLGDITGLRGLHLQCHIGTDTLSLHRLGARMSGLDFSAASLQQACALAAATGVDIDYRLANAYEAVAVFGAGRFDLVYTGIGALCWLPDVAAWGSTVAELLAPGGRLFVREGHPVLWALDYQRRDGLLVLADSYFERAQPVVEYSDKTYLETEKALPLTGAANWNHGLGQIFGALLHSGLRITGFVEHDCIPWCAMPGSMLLCDDGEYRLIERRDRLPLSYTLQASKPVD